MLALGRHRDEAIMIGDRIKVKVLKIEGGKVILGIDAPEEIPVHREEVYLAIKAGTRQPRVRTPLPSS